MTDDINKILNEIYSLSIVDSYELILKIAYQLEDDLKQNNDFKKIELAKKVMGKIYGIRYLISSNKATDRAIFDKKLKEVYESLNKLINIY